MEKGNHGERYILGGENLTYLQLFEIIRDASDCRKRLYHIPLWLMLSTSWLMKAIAHITRNPPLIVPELVRKFNHHWKVSSEKAIRELGYCPLSAKEGIKITVQWIIETY